MLPIESIYGFTGKYSFLSNFYPAQVEYDGWDYPTVEHAYQAAKTLNLDQRRMIQQLKFPGQAKRAGRKVDVRHDWDQIKISIMRQLLSQKFVGYHELSQLLYDTGDAYIEETNEWGDTFWGVCKGKGTNVLGNLLMEIRDNIKPLYAIPY